MNRRLCWALAALLVGCDSGSESSLPADAEAMRNYLQDGVTLILPRLGGAGGFVPFALSPLSPGASGVLFTPDPSPGAAPHSYVFSLDLDGDGNGSNETSFSGSATFTDDPNNAAPGFGGHVMLTMQTAGGLGTLTGDMDFVLSADGGEVSGTGTLSEAITGNTTTLTVAPASPLHIEMAKGTANTVANACGSSLDGNLQLGVAGPTGTMTSSWGFDNTRSTARVTSASFTDNSAQTTNIPDASVTVPCGQTASVSDWNGVFDQNWACVPAEYGAATLTLSVSGNPVLAFKVNVSDEDPPGSGSSATYQASLIPGNPHVVRGYFLSGPSGNTYREDFTWILDPDGDGFTDISRYVYQEGPSTGSGGYCGGSATRAP